MSVRHITTRRGFFHRISDGIHGAALAYLLGGDLCGGTPLFAADLAKPDLRGTSKSYDLKSRKPHFEPKAKAVIQLFMNGGPSQMDLLDPKPMLDKHHGQTYSKIAPNDIQDLENAGALLRSPFQFAQHGQSGIWVSELMPHLARQVDDLAVIRSMFTTNPGHVAALYKIHCGRSFPGLPTIGAWVTYGLGTENQNLPAYVVLDDPLGPPILGMANWQAGFLPPVYQGTKMRTVGSPILNLRPEMEQPSEVTALARDLLARLDRIHKRERPYELELDARISSYELAARLQLEASDALDISKESRQTLEMYGVGNEPKYFAKVMPNSGPDTYARRCLMARRLVERGVRFVQVFITSQIWDTHAHLENDLRAACEQTDQAVGALLKDLKQRGLLDSTLVLWGGEFGRLPIAQLQPVEKVAGRDHNPHGFTVWMAGGGVKRGTVYGATDEIGYEAVEHPVSVADWHATILHLLGLHHDQLFFDRHGLKEKLTFTYEPRILKEILA